MDKILEIAKKHDLFVIEDAAQAHLADINGKPVGTFGDAAAFSFYPTKNMTTAEGGMVILSSSSQERQVRMLRNQGMEVRYQNEIIGFNLRMTDVHAAIGLEQIKKLNSFTEKRIENARILSDYLGPDYAPNIPAGFKHVFHQYTIKIHETRDMLQEHLSALGIQSGVYYPYPVHKLPSFNVNERLIVTEELCRQVISLPIHPKLRNRDIKRIAQAVEPFVSRS
jgi:dTDP-4-amino-4,6-dideoxygalactose transaminase